jgi:hypothetical protein
MASVDEKKLNDLITKYDSLKKQEKMDLSSDQDLSIAVMNLISIEEHLFFTGSKLEKESYYDLIGDVRSMRTDLMKKLVKEPEGEVWCISKHLLAASYRLMEVGTKQQSLGKREEASNFFRKSFNLYSLFWGLNMKLVNPGEVKKIDDDALDVRDTEKKTMFGKLGGVVKKAIDCCIE